MTEINIGPEDEFPPEESDRRFEIALRAACGLPPRNEDERETLHDMAERNS